MWASFSEYHQRPVSLAERSRSGRGFAQSRRRLTPTSGGGAAIFDQPALYTATLSFSDSRGVAMHAFYAMVADTDEAAWERLRSRLGDLAAQLDIRRGFDPAHPFAISLLSEAVSDLLLMVESEPDSPLAKGLDLLVEQRFLP